jgi:2',3'-cyclic-nucleotide 2'-phosphodiesterase/3'-nucleotidase
VKDGLDEPDGSSVTVQLRLLATTDLHVHLLPWDYYADRPLPATGLAQAARLIRALRDEAPGACLLLDNGDVLQGSLLSDFIAAERRALGRGTIHPMIAAMNALGYDAGTLGNHEFDHGLPYLRSILAEAAFPLVSTNLRPGDGLPLAEPWVVLAREVPGPDGRSQTVRIGILGFGPPQTGGWNALSEAGALDARDILDAAREEIPRLRAAGADIIVALCHSGIGCDQAEPEMENAALPLAALPGIDALIVGHTHLVFPDPSWPPEGSIDARHGTLHGKPAVQPGFYGSHVGMIDLWLRRGDEGGWTVAAHSARAIPVPPDLPVDEAVSASAAPAHQRLLDFARRPVGETEVPLQSYFSLVAPCNSLDVVADAKRAEARRLLHGRPEADLPILCTVSPFKSGGRAGPGNYLDIPPGPLALRQAADLYVHPNAFCLVEISGATLRDWLERSAALFCTLTPGAADQPLLDPDVPSYNFDTIDGLSWDFDLSGPARTTADGRLRDPAASRVRNLRHDGQPVADGFLAARDVRLILHSTISTRDIVLAHVRAAPVHPPDRPRWGFVPMPGTAAWFDSGPRAKAHCARDRKVEALDATPEGFLRFRLRL